MNYRYKAMDRDGRIHRGAMAVSHPEALEALLSERGLDLIHCRPSSLQHLPRLRQQVGRPALIQFCFQLEQLLSAGVPILQALQEMEQAEDNPHLRKALGTAETGIQAGKTLSQALEQHPEVFATIVVSLVRVGEQAGRVPAMLQEIGAMLKWQDELAARASRALLYPAFLSLVIAGVALFMFAYLVPKLVSFINTMHATLPLHTRALLAISDLMAAYWPFLVLTMFSTILAPAIASFYSTPVRRRLHGWSLRLPVIGAVLSRLALARVCRTIGMLYGVGMPVLETLRLARTVTGNMRIAEALDAAGDAIQKGASIHVAFRGTNLFPSLVLRMIAVGESTGDLDRTLSKVSEIYDRDTRERLARIETLIEPALTLVLGTLLGWIMLSILGPLYDVITQVRL